MCVIIVAAMSFRFSSHWALRLSKLGLGILHRLASSKGWNENMFHNFYKHHTYLLHILENNTGLYCKNIGTNNVISYELFLSTALILTPWPYIVSICCHPTWNLERLLNKVLDWICINYFPVGLSITWSQHHLSTPK